MILSWMMNERFCWMQAQESSFLSAANIDDSLKFTAFAGKHPTYFSFEHEAELFIGWLLFMVL